MNYRKGTLEIYCQFPRAAIGIKPNEAWKILHSMWHGFSFKYIRQVFLKLLMIFICDHIETSSILSHRDGGFWIFFLFYSFIYFFLFAFSFDLNLAS